MPIRVAMIDDHELHRQGVMSWLAVTGADIEVVGSTATVAELRATPGWAAPIVLLDLDLKDGTTVEDNIALLVGSGSAVIVISGYDEPVLVRRAMRAGARGYVPKSASGEQMSEVIATVAAGGTGMTRALALALLAEDPVRRPALSPREEEVLRMYAAGMALKSVALRLGIRPDTVKKHVDRIRVKYAAVGRPAPTKVELHERAREDGYLTGPRPEPSPGSTAPGP